MGGIRKRCFNLKMADGKIFTFCINWDQWPTVISQAYPKHPTPDPAPLMSLSIDGVKQELLRNLAILDWIRELSENLTPDIAHSVREAIAQGVQKVQKQLPSNITLTEDK